MKWRRAGYEALSSPPGWRWRKSRGASLAGASNSAAGASKSGGDLAGQESNSSRQSASNQAEAALNFLDVAVVGLGEDVCRPDDLVCMKNQKRN